VEISDIKDVEDYRVRKRGKAVFKIGVFHKW